MIGIYDILQGGQAVGRAEVTRQGLYYRICCRCSLTGAVICKVAAIWKDQKTDLGILAPEGSHFSLTARLPVKRAGEGQPEFRVLPKHEPMQENFIPIRAEEPFGYLSRLENAYLAADRGQVGVIIQGAPVSGPQDSGQSQEYPHKSELP